MSMLNIIAASRRRAVITVFEIAGTSRYESTSTAANSHSITVPSGTAVGDVLVAMVSTSGAAIPITAPSGWNAMTLGNSTQGFWKIADSGDLGSLTWTLAGLRTCGIVMVRVTGAHPTTPLEWVIGPASNLNPANLSPSWGAGNYIGITLMGDRNSASVLGSVTAPSGTTLQVSSPPSGASTVSGQAFAAATTLTAVSAWDPAIWTIAGTVSTARTYTVLIRPA